MSSADNELEELIRATAATIARHAQAIADGTVIGSRTAAVIRLRGNVETLAEWVGDDRNHTR